MSDGNWGLLYPLTTLTAVFFGYFLKSLGDNKTVRDDFSYQTIEGIRQGVRDVSLLRIEYDRSDGDERKLLEAKIKIDEVDLRTSMSDLLRQRELIGSMHFEDLRRAEVNFLAALTGGDFGERDPTNDDVAQIEIITASALLRRELKRLRSEQIGQSLPSFNFGVVLALVSLVVWTLVVGFLLGASLV